MASSTLAPQTPTVQAQRPRGTADGTAMRGCGPSRIEGGVYIEVAFDPTGLPLEHYMADSPIPFDVDTKRGVTLVQGPNDTTHIIDHVGSAHYAYPADFIEEGRQHGFSRHVTAHLEWERINRATRVLCTHERAVLTNPGEVRPHYRESALRNRCALFTRSHSQAHLHDPHAPCSRDWYALPTADTSGDERVVPTGLRYPVQPLPPGVQPTYREGIFLSLPITAITVVATPSGSHKATVERIRAAVHDIPVYEVTR